MPTIRQLPTELVNQIAAGEVLERPSSAVKELVENAVDAGAKRIVVELAEGGRESIRVVDDGVGIPREQLPLAVAPHATSKIVSVADLFRVRSFGFRGEALASIAGVSELTLRSRPAEQEIGAEIVVRHGVVGDVRDCGCPPGTIVEVRDLFASVPVRRKFLKAKSTELGHAVEAVTKLALANLNIAFVVKHNDRTVLDRQAGLDAEASAAALLGDDVGAALLPIEAEAGGYRVSGFACHPSVDRPNSRGQYFFVNGRWFRDRSLSHALQEAYRGLTMVGRYPAAVIFMTVPPEDVDVNVHPQKSEVRFVDPHRLFSLVLGAVRQRFLKADLTGQWNSTLTPTGPSQPTATPMVDDEGEIDEAFALAQPALPTTASLWESPPRVETSFGAGFHDNTAVEPRPQSAPLAQTPRYLGPPSSAPAPSIPRSQAAGGRSRAFQLHNAYLVVETDEGMLLVDQHALHERILYEELKQRVLAGALEAQELLVPEPIDLPPVQAGLLLEHRDLLEKLGLNVEEFGERTILVRSQPVLLQSRPLAELLSDIAGQLEESGAGPSANAVLERILSTAACKAAVKAGDPLTPEEIAALLARRHSVEDSHHCPHGRPTVLKFTLQELDKQFKRI